MCGATRETVPARLAAYERIRINRASAIQTLSNAGQDQVQLIHKEAAKYMGSEEAVPSKLCPPIRAEIPRGDRLCMAPDGSADADPFLP